MEAEFVGYQCHSGNEKQTTDKAYFTQETGFVSNLKQSNRAAFSFLVRCVPRVECDVPFGRDGEAVASLFTKAPKCVTILFDEDVN